MSIEGELLMRINKYLRRTGIPASRLGRHAVNDPKLVFDMRAGRSLGPRIQQRLRAWLDDRDEERP
ncbi:MAG: hypothetical protein JOZ90_01920 [Alphaproteobacteria bacterium]|nr:hypothetical protein [Alphaproteobacteria bacterium]MBV9370761.1 hypothetical protein [Alphaproteobacteria bacterium]MBV9899834.1 hypothetical protein [Alphaproteobacteria bacterium]